MGADGYPGTGRALSAIAAAVVFVVVVAAAFPASADEAAPTQLHSAKMPGCALEPEARRAVVRVLDSETIQLDDSTEVRLVGALGPRHHGSGEEWPPERDALGALEALVLGRTVELAFQGRRMDRHGRLLAHVFTEREGHRTWVQGELLASGHARAYALPQSAVCLEHMLGREATARGAELGLWANAAYAVRSSSDTRELDRLRQTFQLVEGRIIQAVRTRSHVYLNFGSDWRSDFTAGITLDKSNRNWAEALIGLEGARVRVRGWIERQNGPYIAITERAQIELLTDQPPGSAAGKEIGPAGGTPALRSGR